MAIAGQADGRHLASLRDYWAANQAFPSMAELCPVLSLSSTSSVSAALVRLQTLGFLKRVGHRFAPNQSFFDRRLVGQVRAGAPEQAFDEESETLTIDGYLVSKPSQTILVKVRGDSMKDAGLMDGDLVVVRTDAAAKDGDIVVALVDGERTVKYLRKALGTTVLSPANSDYNDIVPAQSLEVLGVVTGSFRRYS